ncbi:MFS transporter [Chloroflexi bacterium]|nr:MFS transporter [Chloroflexota bacterium]
MITGTHIKKTFSSFKIRNYRFLWLSDCLQAWAEYMELVVLSWLILEMSSSPFLVGLYGALRFMGTIMSPAFGVLVDRFDRKLLLILVRGSFVMNGLVILGITLMGTLGTVVILVMAALLGLSKTFDMVIRQSILPAVVGDRNLNNGVALARAGVDVTQMIGPVVGGVVLASLNVKASYGIIVVLYFISLFCALYIGKLSPNQTLRNINVFNNLKAGIKFVNQTPVIAGLLVLAVIINLATFPIYFGLISVLAKEVFNSTSSGLGIMMGTYSLGAVLGSLIAGGRDNSRRIGGFAIGGAFLWSAAIILLAVVPNFVISLPILFIAGLGQSICVVAIAMMLLSLTPDNLRGRVMGLRQLAVYSLPVGLLISGTIAEIAGVKTAIFVDGLVGVLLVIGCFLIWPDILKVRSTKEHREI